MIHNSPYISIKSCFWWKQLALIPQSLAQTWTKPLKWLACAQCYENTSYRPGNQVIHLETQYFLKDITVSDEVAERTQASCPHLLSLIEQSQPEAVKETEETTFRLHLNCRNVTYFRVKHIIHLKIFCSGRLGDSHVLLQTRTQSFHLNETLQKQI